MDAPDSNTHRNAAQEIFRRALAASSVQQAVHRVLFVKRKCLLAGEWALSLQVLSRIYFVGMGKAAAPMFEAVQQQLPVWPDFSAVISSPTPPQNVTGKIQYFSGGHPEPNHDSFRAAQAALELLQTADASTLVIFLISGGASAMFEQPLVPDATLEDWIAFNRLLVGCGAPIAEINCVRKHFSAVKGGRLAQAAAGASNALTLLVSDVPAGKLDAVGSGPTLPDSSTVEQCLRVLDQYSLREKLPQSLQRWLQQGIPETPKSATSPIAPIMLLDNDVLLARARDAAEALGYDVVIDSSCDDWECEAAAKYLLHRAQSIPRGGQPLCLLSGGEVTVALPRNPARAGVGGRNQHFALCCGLQLQQMETEMIVLSAGSDGIDGNSSAAGAVADNTTVPRATALDVDAAAHYAAFDANAVFHALGDEIVTGPTGNNLRDLRILLRP